MISMETALIIMIIASMLGLLEDIYYYTGHGYTNLSKKQLTQCALMNVWYVAMYTVCIIIGGNLLYFGIGVALIICFVSIVCSWISALRTEKISEAFGTIYKMTLFMILVVSLI